MDKNVKRLLHKIVDDCIENNVGINFHNNDYYIDDDEGDTAGLFDDSVKGKEQMTIAIKRNPRIISWVDVMAHEYCHFLQWKNKTNIHKKYDKFFTKHGNPVHRYCQGKRVTKKLVKEATRLSVLIEAEAETMTVELLKKYNIPIDIPTYIKNANLYILGYFFTQEYGMETKGISMRMSKKTDIVPDKFLRYIDYEKYYKDNQKVIDRFIWKYGV